MKLYSKLVARKESLSLVGLGYVGMPIAVAFARKGIDVIGFVLNKEKIERYKSGVDLTRGSWKRGHKGYYGSFRERRKET